MRFGVGQRLQTLLAGGWVQGAEVEPGHVQAGFTVNLLTSHPVHARERGAQGFMTQDQRLQGRLETVHIQHTVEPRHPADVVSRAVGLHLPEEPHALLGVRQGYGLAAIDRFNRQVRVVRAGGLNQRHGVHERPQLTGFKQCAQRQFDVTGLPDPRHDLRGQQRVPAQGKEIIAQPDARLPQHFAPDGGNLLLQRGDGLDVFTHAPLR